MSPVVPGLTTNVRRSLYGKMAGDTTLNGLLSSTRPVGYSKSIYYGLAPEGAGFPYVVFNKQSGVPTYTFDTGHAMLDDEIWLIKGVDHNTDSDGVDNVASRLDVLLTDGTLSGISGATQLYLRRESDMPPYVEGDGGEMYFHAGGLYRLAYSVT